MEREEGAHMETITSLQNPYIKLLRTLKHKKGREEQGLYLAEGEKCAAEAMAAGMADCILSARENHLTQAAVAKGIRTVLCSEKIIEAISEVKSPQGVVAIVKKRAFAGQTDGDIFVALEAVSDPQNVGTIIRTADAAGAGAVLLSADSADYTCPKAVRAAMGSTFHLPIIVCADFYGELEKLKQRGVALVAGHLKGKGEMGPIEKACVIIGNEARGLTERAADLADKLYKIPIYGKAESLNAAVAAGIMLYRVRETIETT